MNSFVFLAMPGTGSMILIVVAILLLFGGKKIPELMKGLGTGIKEFKNASKGEDTSKSETTSKKDTSADSMLED